MSKPAENNYYKTRQLIDKIVEPKIKALVDELNKHLEKQYLQVIAEITWEIHPLKTKEDKKDGKN